MNQRFPDRRAGIFNLGYFELPSVTANYLWLSLVISGYHNNLCFFLFIIKHYKTTIYNKDSFFFKLLFLTLVHH